MTLLQYCPMSASRETGGKENVEITGPWSSQNLKKMYLIYLLYMDTIHSFPQTFNNSGMKDHR